MARCPAKCLLILCAASLAVGCDQSHTNIDCWPPSSFISISVPADTKSLMLAGQECPAKALIECGAFLKTIENPGQECAVQRIHFDGTSGKCEVKLVTADDEEIVSEVTWKYNPHEIPACSTYDTGFDDEGAALIAAGVDLAPE